MRIAKDRPASRFVRARPLAAKSTGPAGEG
ncbi:MAG: hypothetical protein JWP35_469 [Caulobacter sp.]|nr:hypothetical protein [Caulobacter sp.]